MPAPDYAQTIQPFTFPQIGSTAPSYDNIMKMLSQPTQTESQFLPEIQQVLGQRSQFLQPAITGIEQSRGRGMANLEGAFGRRGMVGGSIEANALGDYQGGTQAQIAEMLGRFALENSQLFANLMARARSGDVAAQRTMMQMLAQAMGEELTAGRDMQMFREGMQERRASEGRQHLAGQQAAGWQLGADLLKGGSQLYGGSKGWF